MAGAALAGLLFGVSAVIHLIQMIMKRTWFYTPMTVGSIMMTAGYAFRYLSAKDPTSIMKYIGQSLLIILPPSLYAATIYMIYGRIVLFVNSPSASVIRPQIVTKIFVTGDVVAFFMQAGGGGMMAQASMANLGQKVILGGLLFQLLFFGFFLSIAIIFERRISKSTKSFTVPQVGKHTWHKMLMLLFVGAAVIIGRCAYRIVEFGQGMDGALMKHEVYMYIGDTAPMFLVQVLFHIVHAGDVFPKGGVQKGAHDETYINLAEV
ncbi:RTA1 domain protein [Rutstroemia sp. NJR-2017a BBW]|nr:RTA1 domain protein [Rutstroemia sp. NJR-2017a BBW]